jgi:hypothetical protein
MKHLPKALLLCGAFTLAMTSLAGTASAAITITPPSTAFTAALTGSAVFTAANGLAVTCTASSASGTTAASGPSVSFAPPTFSGCTASSGHSASVVVTTTTATCKWTLTITNVTMSGSTGAATAPGGKQGDGTECMSINITLFGAPVCSITISNTTVPITYVNGTTTLSTDFSNAVPYTTSGGICGSAANATYAAGYLITPNSFQATNT